MLHNLELEQTLLGLSMTDADCAEQLATLPEDTFHFPETKALFRIVRDIVKKHDIPNVVSVGSKIPGSAVEMMECSKKCISLSISPAAYKRLEQDALDLRKRRLFLSVCEKVANQAADPGIDVDEMAASLSGAITDDSSRVEGSSLSDELVDWLDGLNDKECAINTGIAGIDHVTGGMQKGSLVVLGARPKVGKTALALSIATNVARKTGPVLIVSLEMKPKEIIDRLMASETGVDMQKFVTKNLSTGELEAMSDSLPELGEMKIRFTNKQTPLQIRRCASNMQRTGGLSLIVVDYIQLMKTDGNKKSRYEEVSEISRELKLMAMDLNVPILALTQFNRESEQGGQKRKPSMSDARDSGSIEQDANIFMIQYAPPEPQQGSELYSYWARCQEQGVEFQILEVAANRQGPTGAVLLRFDKAHMRFTTLGRNE